MSKKLTEPLPYTYPEVYRGPKEWYVYFHYMNPQTGEMERFKDSWGLNKKKNLHRREQVAADLISVIADELKKGFNPFEAQNSQHSETTHSIVVQIVEDAINTLSGESATEPAVLSQLQTIVDAWVKTESASAGRTYRTMLTRFRRFLNHNQMSEIPASEVNIDTVREYQRYLIEIKKNGPKR